MINSIRDTQRRSNSSKTYGTERSAGYCGLFFLSLAFNLPFNLLFRLIPWNPTVYVRFEDESFVRVGVGKGDCQGVEVEPVAFCTAIEQVAYEGTGQAVEVGGMDAQLVGSACYRAEYHFVIIDDFVAGKGFFALFVVYLLSWSLVVVGA